MGNRNMLPRDRLDTRSFDWTWGSLTIVTYGSLQVDDLKVGSEKQREPFLDPDVTKIMQTAVSVR